MLVRRLRMIRQNVLLLKSIPPVSHERLVKTLSILARSVAGFRLIAVTRSRRLSYLIQNWE